eukprot:1191887-Prorocentrum_minimum.AAC.1
MFAASEGLRDLCVGVAVPVHCDVGCEGEWDSYIVAGQVVDGFQLHAHGLKRRLHLVGHVLPARCEPRFISNRVLSILESRNLGALAVFFPSVHIRGDYVVVAQRVVRSCRTNVEEQDATSTANAYWLNRPSHRHEVSLH